MGPAALIIFVWLALWAVLVRALRSVLPSQQTRYGISALLSLLLVAAAVQIFDRLYVRPRFGDLSVVEGISGRFWRDIEREQAQATVRLMKTVSNTDALLYAAVWRESETICVRMMGWSKGQYQTTVPPGVAQVLQQKVFPTHEVCVGFEGDSLVAWPPECTRADLTNACPHSAAAHDYSPVSTGHR